MPDLNKPYRGWKLSYFEGGVHLPYIVSYPKGIEAGQTYDGRVSSLDIFATVGNLAGATLPTDRKIDGTNILPFLSGEQEGDEAPVVPGTASTSSVNSSEPCNIGEGKIGHALCSY